MYDAVLRLYGHAGLYCAGSRAAARQLARPRADLPERSRDDAPSPRRNPTPVWGDAGARGAGGTTWVAPRSEGAGITCSYNRTYPVCWLCESLACQQCEPCVGREQNPSCASCFHR